MNRENLQRMADHIRTVPQELFDMGGLFRHGQRFTAECDGKGDVIGHCTILDKDNLIYNQDGTIDFLLWADVFTGWLHIDEHAWLFCSAWRKRDNTPEGAALRIEWLLNHGVPENWFSMIFLTKTPLCYLSDQVKSSPLISGQYNPTSQHNP